MNNWPMASHYSTTLQNPQVAFRDPELRKCKIKTTDGTKQPRGISGNFAVVYQGELPNGSKRAVRAFTSERKEIAERYQKICGHLEKNRHVSSLVNFVYAEKGIRASNGNWYPLVTMDWVSGVTLFEWVGARCAEKNRQALAAASEQWVQLVNELSAARIVHGDLQHANVMVTQRNELKLVDYDGMCVPGLENQRNIEIGVAPYQHPERDGDTLLSFSLDNFSSIFIYTALKALSTSPELWQQHVVATAYDKLLFSKRDFENTSQSALYQTLLKSPDNEIRDITRRMFELYHGKLKEVPSLQNFLFSFDDVIAFLDQRNYDAAVESIDSRGQRNNVPSQHLARVNNAIQRVACRRELEAKVSAGDEFGMEHAYQPALLDDYPAAQQAVTVARLAGRVIPILQELRDSQQQQKWRDFVHVWDRNLQLLGDRKSVQRFKSDVDRWRPRNQLCEKVFHLLKQPNCSVAELAATWQQLNQLGGHPEAKPQQGQVERLIKRDAVWRQLLAPLREAGAGPSSEQNDATVARLWDEAVLKGWPEAEQQRPALNAARGRMSVVSGISQSLSRCGQTVTLAGESEVAKLAASLPVGYRYASQARAETARRRIDCRQKLLAAIKAGQETQIASHWSTLCQLQSQSLVDNDEKTRAVQAEQRMKAWPSFQAMAEKATKAPGTDVDTQLRRLWNEALFRDWPQAEDERHKVDRARDQLAVADQLAKLLARNAQIATMQAEQDLVRVAGGLPKGYEFVHRPRVELAIRRVQTVEQLKRLLKSAAVEEEIIKAWQDVEQVQAKSLVEAQDQSRVAVAQQRTRAWQQFDPLLQQAVSEDRDRRLQAAWNESVFRGWQRAERNRAAVTEASGRLAVLEQLGQLNQRFTNGCTVVGEQQFVDLSGGLPDGYQFALDARVRKARQRLDALEQLSQALIEPAQDNVIAEAWKVLCLLQGQSLVDAQARQRVTLAENRLQAWAPFAAALGQVKSAPGDGSDLRLGQAWNETLFANWTQAEIERPQLDEAKRRLQLVQEIQSTIQKAVQQKTLDAERAVVSTAQPLSARYEFSQKARVEQAWQRVNAVDRMHQLVSGSSNEETIRDCWQVIAGLRAEVLVNAPARVRAKLAQDRLLAWSRFEPAHREATTALSDTADEGLLLAWNEKLFKGWSVAESKRGQLLESRKRIELLKALQPMIVTATHQPSFQSARQIVDLVRPLPPVYQFSGKERTDQARRHVDALTRLSGAITADTSEHAIADAWNTLVAARGQQLATAQQKARVDLAGQRLPVLGQLQQIPSTLPADQYDARILSTWRDPLLRNCRQAQAWQAHYQVASHRATLVKRLAGAVANEDEPTIAEIIAEPCMQGYPLDASWHDAIRKAQALIQRAQSLVTALNRDDRLAFAQQFDARLVRRFPLLFEAVQDKLVTWTKKIILAGNVLPLSPARGRNSVIRDAETTYRVRWTWPEPRITDDCFVGVSRGRPDPRLDPREASEQLMPWRTTISRNTYQDGCLIHWNKPQTACVFVVAIVELGFCSLTSEPVELGMVQPAAFRSTT